MKILVTGASGTVGGFVIRELEGSHELRLTSRRPVAGRHPHVAGDLTDPELVRRAVAGVDAIAHLGANPWFSPDTFRTNTVSTYLLLEACREAGVKRFVMAGSDWGIGKSDERDEVPDYVPVDEAHPVRPHDNYGLSKSVCERVCETFGREYGIACAVMRITGVWTPDKTAGYAAQPRTGAAEGLKKYWWSYVDARDVARAFRLALEATGLPPFGTYFLSAADTLIDEPTTEAVRRWWPEVRVAGPLEGHASVLSTEAARRAFGWSPQHSWR